ncbi:MAG: hypothetical protein FWG50_07430 [Kiritimatiellaeota bacterium]|nr:hypothetical protein [Kiritimatiellota bacterium]
MRRHHKTKRRCAGQAAVEFCIGLIALMLLVTGMIHVSKMARASLGILGEIRAEAGEMAMLSTLGTAPEAISDWDSGADKIRHTADDKPRLNATASMGIMDAVVRNSVGASDDWMYVNDVTRLPVSMVQLHGMMGLSVFLSGTQEDDTLRIKVDPFIRQLLFDAQEVNVKEEVWMPQMGGLF